MSEQDVYSISAACLGFVSACFFGIASAFTSKSKIVALSKTCWGFNKEFVAATVSQSTQYAIGALLLVLSFILQVLAITASQASEQWISPFLLNHWLFVPSLLVVVGLPSFILSTWLSKLRLSQVVKELEKKP